MEDYEKIEKIGEGLEVCCVTFI